MKEAVRLLVYLLATLLLGALLAPVFYWSAQTLVGETSLREMLGRYDFETFFHRALLLAALILLWPFARSLQLRRLRDLQLEKNPRWRRDAAAGFVLAAVPLLCYGAMLLILHVYVIRSAIRSAALAQVVAAAVVVPLIEEAFFRGLVLGLLVRSVKRWLSILLTSVFYSVVHFLKAPDQASPNVTWLSGFNSIFHAFVNFRQPMLVAAGFTTLFLIGWILADARLRTRSLWLPIGLHAGWIFGRGVFQVFTHREFIIMPWLGRSLLVGFVPLAVAGLTWVLMRGWLRYADAAKA